MYRLFLLGCLLAIAQIHIAWSDNTVFKCKSQEHGFYYQSVPCDGVEAVTNWSDKALAKSVNVVNQSSSYNSLIVKQDLSGHYFVKGFINNVPIRFLIDTGASTVLIPNHLAKQAKLPCNRQIVMNTANGDVTDCETTIEKLRFGSFSVENINGAISKHDDDALLGMNVLQQFKIEQTNGELRITKH